MYGYPNLHRSTKIYKALFIDKHFYLLIGAKAQTLSACHPTWSEAHQTWQPGPAISEDLVDANKAPPVHLQRDSEPIYSQLPSLQIHLVWRPSNSRCTPTSINPAQLAARGRRSLASKPCASAREWDHRLATHHGRCLIGTPAFSCR